MENRFEIYKDFNTKDWVLYDNETNRNVIFADTRQELEDLVEKVILVLRRITA